MARLGANIPTAVLAALIAVAPARAQSAGGARPEAADPNASELTATKKKKTSGADEELKRLDPSTLAGGDYGAPDNAALAGGDYGVPPLNPEEQEVAPRIPQLRGPLDAPPSGRRKLRPLPPPVGNPRDDAFEPIGIRAGSFVLKPSLESSYGYDDNPNRVPDKSGQASRFYRLRGGLDARSDWSRHELDLRVDGQIRRYLQHGIKGYEPNGTAALDGRLDVSRDTKINAELRTGITTSRRGDPDTPTNLKGDEIQKSIGATLGVDQTFNRFSLKLDGLVDRYMFDDSELVDGTKVSNKDRIYNAYGLKLRGTYELSPRLAPFAEVAIDTRDYDLKREKFTGRIPGSDGYALRTGARFELSDLVSGEASIGYGRQTPKDNDLKAVDGLLVDGALEWRPTGLTTVRVNARTDFAETTLPGAGGVLDRAVGVSLEHRLRRNLIVTARADLDRQSYKGIGQTDDRFTYSLDVDYLLTRDISMFAQLQRERLKSNAPGLSYVANIIEFGLRLRR